MDTLDMDTFGGLFKIVKGASFYSAMNKYLTNQDNKPYWDFFNTKQYRIAPEVISSRTMNHWQQEGLLPDKCQEKEQQRRSFTLMDIIWIGIIKNLRSIGVDLSFIKKIKKKLNIGLNSCEYSELEFYTALSFFQKMPCEILIFFDGTAEVGTIDEINLSKEKYGLNSHISLSLNIILQAIFRDKDLQPIYNTWVDLNEKETKVLEKIKSGKFNNLSLTLKDGEVLELKGGKAYNEKVQFHNIQREFPNQDLQIKMRGGKIRHIEQIIDL